MPSSRDNFLTRRVFQISCCLCIGRLYRWRSYLQGGEERLALPEDSDPTGACISKGFTGDLMLAWESRGEPLD